MKNGCPESDIIVRPVGGMQLSEGCIRRVESQKYIGSLPGISDAAGDTIEEVLRCLTRSVKAYYGDDVVVELVQHLSFA